MWANERWKGGLFPKNCRSSEYLAHYSQYFNAVEGNTTFYADPTPETIERWAHAVPTDFRFTLKVPKRLSHQPHPEVIPELRQWLNLLKPLQSKIGFIHLQLPASNSVPEPHKLKEFIHEIHQFAPCCVEVRHLNFFDKAQHEKVLHQILRAAQAERMCFDSRALFSVVADTAELIDAQAKKPRLPVHAVALTDRPSFRFIGVNDMEINRQFYQPWLLKMQQWLLDGKTPYAFFHTPDNQLAPELARQFAEDLFALTGQSHPVLAPWPEAQAPVQQGLF
jgi:uncharacterized protein YecE (DUF72 family)